MDGRLHFGSSRLRHPSLQGWKWMNRLSPTTWTLWGLVGSQLCDRDDVQMTGGRAGLQRLLHPLAPGPSGSCLRTPCCANLPLLLLQASEGRPSASASSWRRRLGTRLVSARRNRHSALLHRWNVGGHHRAQG